MKVCETCGFGLWRYNQDTLTCKHGHLWMEDGKPVGEHAPVRLTPAKPQRPYLAPVERRTLDLPMIGCGLLLLVDVVTRLLA